MGQRLCCCCCRLPDGRATAADAKHYKRLDENLHTGRATTLSVTSPPQPPPQHYRPPSEAQVLPATALQRRPPGLLDLAALAFPTGASQQDGYPPPFFKRLDQHIRANGFRARDVFLVLDSDGDRAITVDEMLSGLHRIDFQLSKREEKMLREWMQQIVGHDLSFKEFALALKQRASLTSPQRISILKLAKQ